MRNLWSGMAVAGVLGMALSAAAQELPSEGPSEARALISVESKQPVNLDPAQLKIEVNGHATPVEGLIHVQPAQAQIAILIDDGLSRSFGVQVEDIRKFVANLPPGVQVLVGYMRNGGVVTEQGFTTDHAAVAAKIRQPLGSPGISASPYFCLSDFAKKWPLDQPGPRFVMMLTNGVDPYNGSVSIMNQDSPYVQSAIRDAQRAGIAVYAIAYRDAGMRGGAAQFSGQSYLENVASDTGGRSLWNGMGNPVSLQPFLNEFRSSIAESYTATFHARQHGKELARVKITSSQPGVKIHAPNAVPAGGGL